MVDSYLFDIGWMFFAAWSLVVFAVCVAAFGRDLFPQPKHSNWARDLQTVKSSAARTISR
jgi:hypothetical protein